MSSIQSNDWGIILESIRDQECVLFLGASASLGFGQIGLPSARGLAEEIAAEFGYPGNDKEDFLRVCQYVELVQDKRVLREWICKRLNSVNELQPSRLHRVLASLPLKYVLTTNYDNLMETAFIHAGKNPRVALYDMGAAKSEDIEAGTETSPVVYKLHGTLDKISSMICTEDDIIEFSARLLLGNPGLPLRIRNILQSYSILFIGYGLRDWNVRIMLRALRAERFGGAGVQWAKSFAIQRATDADWDSVVLYFSRMENIVCFDRDALEFVEGLAERFTNHRLSRSQLVHAFA
jgi:SIR2-like domain